MDSNTKIMRAFLKVKPTSPTRVEKSLFSMNNGPRDSRSRYESGSNPVLQNLGYAKAARILNNEGSRREEALRANHNEYSNGNNDYGTYNRRTGQSYDVQGSRGNRISTNLRSRPYYNEPP